ncbi:hypothetical protein LPC08_22290 [Roseomonas sp. OT10]|uniref:Rap1a/Tai family immunity protein n=1 Tax=Roseomonas cutis TaxID=2897332 RepID=UPI001E3C389E|nr:Rap1a/Tai family immunity protein [Roseomonas sp. OT10]UFN48707.1 hypothetical protein LPC08_22290 [Roseomonas sp. OT10]
MQKIFGVAAAAALLGLSGAASAQTPVPTAATTAGELGAICLAETTGVPRLEAIAYCQGYLTAMGQYHAALHPAGGRQAPLFCLPNPPPTVAQSGVAFGQWMRQNPQYGSEAPLDGLLRWAQATYPCPAAAAPSRRGR